MIPELTEEMRQAISQHPECPVHVVDTVTQTKYVLLPDETYERVRALVMEDDDPDPDDFLPLAHEAFAEAWDAPGMDQYDDASGWES
jgi:hypothetical protein